METPEVQDPQLRELIEGRPGAFSCCCRTVECVLTDKVLEYGSVYLTIGGTRLKLEGQGPVKIDVEVSSGKVCRSYSDMTPRNAPRIVLGWGK